MAICEFTRLPQLRSSLMPREKSWARLVDERPRVDDRSERVEVAEQGCCIVEDEPYFIDDLLIGIDVPIASNHVISICAAICPSGMQDRSG